MPRTNSLVLYEDSMAIVIACNPDDEYYPGEEKWHPAITIRYIDTSVQESENIVFIDGSASLLVCLNDITVLRKARVNESYKYIQSIAYGIDQKRACIALETEKKVCVSYTLPLAQLYLLKCVLYIKIRVIGS